MRTPEHPTPHKRRSRIVTVAAWLAACCCAPLCLAWVLGARLYLFDILASQQLLISMGAAGVAVVLLLLRRIVPGLLVLVLASISVSPIVRARVWSLPEVDLVHQSDGVLRVVSCNLNPMNPRWDEDTRALLDLDADIVILLEIPFQLSRSINRRGFLDGTPYRHVAIRGWVKDQTSTCYLLSKHPMRVLEYGGDPEDAKHHLHAVVSLPQGDLVVGLMHPLSPRTEARWHEGNRVAQTQADEARRLHEETGLPVLIGADLNAAPAQIRARRMRAAGLRMCKPLLRPEGSFPSNAGVPAWAAPQLDDVWVLGGVRPIAWSMTEPPGSDHRAVIVDLRLPDR